MDVSTDDEISTTTTSDDVITSSSPAKASNDADDDRNNAAAVGGGELEDMATVCPLAVVTWRRSDGETQYLGQQQQLAEESSSPSISTTTRTTAFEMHVEAGLLAALFKIRVPLTIQGRRNKINAYLYIYPEQILTLCLSPALCNDEDRCGCAVARETLNGDVYCLRFALDRAPALIVPKDEDIVSMVKGKASQRALDSLRLLASNTSFAVHIPVTALARTRLVSLCQAASTSSLRTLQRVAILASLYGGKGGKVVQPQDETCTNDNPPPYRESVTTGTRTSKKRRRMSSSLVTCDGAASDVDDRHIAQAEVEKHLIAHLAAKMEQISDRLTSHVDDGFTELRRRMTDLESRLCSLERQVHQHVGDMNTRIDRQEDVLRVDFERQLEDLRDEVDIQIEDKSVEARDDVKQYVREEVVPDVEERVRQGILEQLRTALNDD